MDGPGEHEENPGGNIWTGAMIADMANRRKFAPVMLEKKFVFKHKKASVTILWQ